MKRVLVTGANGFTGRYLGSKLAGEGHQVHGLAKPGDRGDNPPAGVQIHQADLGDRKSLEEVVRAVRPDWLVHLAAISFVAHGDAADIYEANLIGSRNLLQAVADSELRPSAVLLASSANIYGNRRAGALTEDALPQPVNDYGISKLAMELVAKLFADRLPIIVARPFNYTGAGQSTDFIIPKIIDHARRRVPTIKLGNIDVHREFSDVRGVAEIYARLLGAPQAIGGTFNVCSGQPHSLREVITMVERLSNHAFEIEVDPALVRSNEVPVLYGDNSRLAAAIGTPAMPPLSDTLKWMLGA